MSVGRRTRVGLRRFRRSSSARRVHHGRALGVGQRSRGGGSRAAPWGHRTPTRRSTRTLSGRGPLRAGASALARRVVRRSDHRRAAAPGRGRGRGSCGLARARQRQLLRGREWPGTRAGAARPHARLSAPQGLAGPRHRVPWRVAGVCAEGERARTARVRRPARGLHRPHRVGAQPAQRPRLGRRGASAGRAGGARQGDERRVREVAEHRQRRRLRAGAAEPRDGGGQRRHVHRAPSDPHRHRGGGRYQGRGRHAPRPWPGDPPAGGADGRRRAEDPQHGAGRPGAARARRVGQGAAHRRGVRRPRVVPG